MTHETVFPYTANKLEYALRSGKFAVTAELGPVDSADPQAVLDNAALFGGVVDGINVTDASGAHVHMSSVAASTILAQAGYTPIYQLSCRDRNRIAMQGDIVGAAALGIPNVLCLTGDGVQVGDHPQAKPVFDFDSIQAIQMVRTLRDKSTFLSGRAIAQAPKMFIGGASNPFAPPYNVRPRRLAKKIQAGADFVQSQYCFDVPLFQTFMKQARDMGLHEKVYYLVGVGPLRSAKAAKWMRNNVPGVWIPDSIIERLEKTPKKEQREEGFRICTEIIEQVREIEGVHGIHMMAYKQEAYIPELLGRAGLLPETDDVNKAV